MSAESQAKFLKQLQDVHTLHIYIVHKTMKHIGCPNSIYILHETVSHWDIMIEKFTV
jgi:hypothetical protein